MLIAEYSRKRKLDGYNLHVRISEEDANINHYNTIFTTSFPDNVVYDSELNEFVFNELEGNLLYKYLYILNKFVLKCSATEMNQFKKQMKTMCQKRLVKVDYRIYDKESFTQDYTEEDAPTEIRNEFSHLFTSASAPPPEEQEPEEVIEEVIEPEQEVVVDVDTNALESERQALESEKQAFESEKQLFESERHALEQEKQLVENRCEQERIEHDREVDMLKQKLEFFQQFDGLSEKYDELQVRHDELVEEHKQLQEQYDELKVQFDQYLEQSQEQVQQLEEQAQEKELQLEQLQERLEEKEQQQQQQQEYEPVDLSLYTKPDTNEIKEELSHLFESFEEKIQKMLGENKNTSHDILRLKNTVTSLEMENTELRRENEDIYEKLTYCEKQFDLIKQKYIKLQQLKHKYKTMVVNGANTNHIEELPSFTFKRNTFSPIPDEPVRQPYR